MAENSDINIRLNIKPGEDDAGQFVDKAVSDVGKDAKESSEQAERLLKMITEIVSRLNGLDSGAAKALKKDLLDISSILGKLDSAPLKSIGNTISEIAKKKDSLTDGDMSSFADRIRNDAQIATVDVRASAEGSTEAVDAFAQKVRDAAEGSTVDVKAEVDGSVSEVEALSDDVKDAAQDATIKVGTEVDGSAEEVSDLSQKVQEAAKGATIKVDAEVEGSAAETKNLADDVKDAAQDATIKVGTEVDGSADKVKNLSDQVRDAAKGATIEVDAKTDGSVADVGEEADDAAEKMAGLAEAVASAMGRLNEIDPSVVKSVSAEMLDMMDAIDALDASGLEKIGPTISGISEAAKRLDAGSVDSFVESLKKATAEAKALHDSVAGATSSADSAAGEKIAEVGEEAERSSDHAARLLTVIAELIDKLNGMDSDAAKKLRDDLQQLAEVVNTLDTARLEHLDSILESLTATGKKVADQTGDVSKKIKQVTDEAQKFKDSFSNDAGVKVNVTFDAADSMKDLRQKIDITEEANDLIKDLGKIRKELDSLGNNRKVFALSGLLNAVERSFKNLDPKNVKDGAAAFERLTKAIKGLSDKDRSVLKSFDFSKIDRQVSGITDKIKSTAKETDKIGFITDLLQGKFSAVGDRIIDLIQKTKTWQKAVASVGQVKAAAAIGAISAAIGVAIKIASDYIDRINAARREYFDQRLKGSSETIAFAKEMYEYKNNIRDRASRKFEAERDDTLARSIGWQETNNAAINTERQRKLLTTTDPAEREKINREADRKIADNNYESERWKIGIEDDKISRNLKDLKAKKEDLEDTIEKYAAGEAEANATLTELTKGNTEAWEIFKNNYKVEDADVIRTATEQANEATQVRKRAAQELEDLEQEIDIVKQKQKSLAVPRAKLKQERDAELAKRKAEDAERQRGYKLANDERAYEVSERNRRNKEADEEAERSYQDQMRTFAERLKALNEVLDNRVAEREEKQNELDALMKKYEGKGEQAWSAEDKSERRKAEDAIERLTGTIRSLRTEARNAQRAGDTEGVQFARGRREERREREEADRALLNQWRERMGGPAATASVAYDEAQTRKAQLAESTKRQNDLIESVRQRLIAEKRIGANEKVDFENLKYNKLMTDAEREAYDNNRSDIRRDTANVKTAASRVAEVEADRADRFAEFRDNAMKQSNRLTAMGLGGGAVVGDFGRATADNTRRANELLKDILGALKADGGTESGKKLMDSLSSWSM